MGFMKDLTSKSVVVLMVLQNLVLKIDMGSFQQYKLAGF